VTRESSSTLDTQHRERCTGKVRNKVNELKAQVRPFHTRECTEGHALVCYEEEGCNSKL
jgi:hypothetical protein